MATRAEVSFQSNQQTKWLGDLAKRVFDVVVSLTVLVLFAPFYGLIAVAIKRDTPGPVFYRGKRVGRGGEPFDILKFRTMFENKESYAGPKVTAQDDARITPVGRWLRDTKLNEFPQFWNVLKGDMSLVGPRPEDPTLAQSWPEHAAQELMAVRPGITSPASVLYRNEENMLHAKDVLQKYLHELSPDKMRLDQLYVRYRSVWLDLDTMIWTALLLLPKIRAYSPPETLLFVGPVTRFIKRYMSWFVRDLLVVFFSLTATRFILDQFGILDLDWVKLLEMAMAFSLIYNCVGVFTGTNRISWTKATSWDATRLGAAWLITTGMALAIHNSLGLTTRLALVLICPASIFALFGFVIVRYRGHLATVLLSRLNVYGLDQQAVRERVLIVGSGRTAEHIAWLLRHPAYSRKFRVVGLIDDDLFAHGMNIYGAKVVGGTADIATIVEQKDVGVIILADHRMKSPEYHEFHAAMKKASARVFVMPDIFGWLHVLSEEAGANEVTTNWVDFGCQGCMSRYGFLTNLDELHARQNLGQVSG